jgi:predicted transcriptional regulator
MSPHEDIKYLAGSPYRSEILAALRTDDLRPAELTERIDATRTTVQRILSGFRDREWIVKSGPTYRTTVTGQRVLEAYRSLETEVQRAEAYGPFGEYADEVSRRLAPELFTETTVTRATDQQPFAPIERYIEVTSQTQRRIRTLAPIVSQESIEIVDAYLSRGVEFELVIDGTMFDAFKHQYRETLLRWNDPPVSTIWVSPESIDFGLSINEDIVLVGAIDEGRNLTILAEGTDASLREAAIELFTERKQGTTPVEELLSN